MAHLRQLAGMANFTEIYTVDFKRDIMLMSHMQECNPAFAKRDRKIKLLYKKIFGRQGSSLLWNVFHPGAG